MKANDYLFPNRLTRRDFLKMAGAASAAVALPALSRADDQTAPVRIGTGYHTYEAQSAWGKLPDGMKYGLGCGVIVDSRDRVFVTSRSVSPCVSIFDREGNLLETWSKDFADKVGFTTEEVAATAHCLYLSKEGGNEFIYWTENVAGKEKKYGARVYKTDLRGKIIYQVGNVEKEDAASQKFDWTNPTDVAVAPNGDIYVVDGYGSQRVSHFDKDFKHIKTIGGHGKEHGKFNTCHGIWINTLKSEPEAYIADRGNGRIEVFSLDLEYKRTLLDGVVRNPCCFYQHKDKIYIPDLASRVTVIDANDQVVAQLGDGRGPDGKDLKDNQTNPALFAKPHALCLDSRGDLYVVEWVNFGRPRKFKHTPQA